MTVIQELNNNNNVSPPTPKSTKHKLDLPLAFISSRDKLCLIPTPDFPYAPYHSIGIDPHDRPTRSSHAGTSMINAYPLAYETAYH